MAVEALGTGEVDGYGDSMEAFRQAHEQNSNALLNLLEGKKKNAPRPAYDPQHPDNQWPRLVYHPAKGEKLVGVNLKGMIGPARKTAESQNNADLQQAGKDGYRAEPYPKPQVAVLDPATEKAALVEQNQKLQGQITQQADQLAKLTALVEALAKKG